MTKPNVKYNSSWSRTLQTGAVTGIAVTFVYAGVFALYAIVRSSATIAVSMPLDISLIGTLVANAMSIAIASIATATLLSLFTACLGMLTAAVIKELVTLFNPHKSVQRSLFMALVASVAIVLFVDFGIQSLMQRSLNSLGLETYLFWFGFPALVQIGAGVVGAWYLHRSYIKNSLIGEEVHHVSAKAYSRTG
jgi:hypothetical protein